MSNVLVNDASLTAIANAIRSKLSTSDTYKPGQMASAIQSIPTGGSAVLGTKSITANGTYNASSDGYDGYSQVVANVPNTYTSSDEGKVVSNGYLIAQFADTVTTNGIWDTTFINSLTVNVSGGGSGTDLRSGTYTPATNTLGLNLDVGINASHFIMYSTTAHTGHGAKAFGAVIADFTNSVQITVGTNNAGSSYAAYRDTFFSKSGTSIICTDTATSGGHPGYWIGGLTYQWYAW